MQPKNIFTILSAVSFTSILLFSSCKKSDDFVNPVYQCGCGVLNWNSTEFQLLDANYIRPDSANFLSRRYYITAKVNAEGEEMAHNINVTMELDSVDQAIFFVDNEDLSVLIDEVNYNDPILSNRVYLPVEGVVNITPAILGGTETVSFNFSIKELYNGVLSGFPIPFSGSFNVLVDY